MAGGRWGSEGRVSSEERGGGERRGEEVGVMRRGQWGK